MEERIIALSQGMGLYQERGILSKASIEKVELRPSFNDPLCLMITDYYPSPIEMRQKEYDLNPRGVAESIVRGIAGVKENPIQRAATESQIAAVECMLMREHKKLPASCKQVALDLIQAVTNSGLIQPTSKLRCWMPYLNHPAECADIFLDENELVMVDRDVTTFYLERRVNCSPIQISIANKKVCIGDFSSTDILNAYAYNLQQGLTNLA